MTSLPRPLRATALATVLAVLALGVTACGDDDPEAGPTDPPSTSETAVETPSETPSETSPTPSETPSETASPSESVPPTTLTPTPEPTPEPEPSTAPPSSGTPQTFDDAMARFDALGQEPQDLERFRTRNGTYCLLDSDFAIGCELRGGGVRDEAYCGDGPSQVVGRILFPEDGSGPTPECNSDTIREPGAPLLADDLVARSSATGVMCLVEKAGVTCVDEATSRGFFLSKVEYTFFNAG